MWSSRRATQGENVMHDTSPAVLRLWLAGIFLLLVNARVIAAENSGLQVVFFPSIAAVSDNGQGTMTVQGRVFTPATGAHAGLVRLTAQWISTRRKVQVNRRDEPFRFRARQFFSDSRRNARVSIKLGTRTIDLPASDASGYFHATVPISADELKSARDGVISFVSVTSSASGQSAPGTATVVPRDAMVVVTDMDDTIKDTNVLDRASAELNTFVNPFRPVAGMPETYRNWNSSPGAKLHFHVVSAGPWQLYKPLREFTDAANFPPFTWDMRPVDIGFNPVTALRELHPSPDVIFRHKVAKISALLKQLPNQLVLVGDSAEQDPEVYAEIVKACPDRIAAAYIRDIPGARARNYDTLFRSSASMTLRRFRTASEIPSTLSNLSLKLSDQCR